MEEGFGVSKSLTHGYEFETNGGNLNLLNHWRDNYGLLYETDRVTNDEHPDYGKYFYKFSLFRDPTLKSYDISDVMKRINK